MTPLWQFSISASPETEDSVVALFEEVFGLPPCVYTDAFTGAVSVSAYVNEPPGSQRWHKTILEKKLQETLGLGTAPKRREISVRRIQRQDWAESWKRHFRPFEVGRSLLIKPSWSRKKPRRGQSVIVLDPGLSFGTGQHPTTRYCLEQVVRQRQPGRPQAFLDVGTGSGILAIAAARLGYQLVVALDSDPDAVKIAARNARVNGLRSRIQFLNEDMKELRSVKPGFNLVCANLTVDLVVSERGGILNCLAPDGVLVVAGILTREFADVSRCYTADGLKLISSRGEKEWRSGVFRWRR